MDTPWVLVSKAKIKTSDEWYASLPASVRIVRYLPKKPLIRFATLFLTDNARIERIETSKDPATNQPIFELYTRPRQHYSKEHLYSGQIFLLTDRNSYSMSGMFAAIMKDYQRAILVGEETGGLANPHGSNVAVTLPESKFRFTISTSRAYRPSGVFDNRGVIPDIAVPFDDLSKANTIDELLELTARGR
jgi:C-terminal processing protease CtpA/Prc